MRNREPLKPVDDFDRCAIRNKIHEFYTVRRQLPTIAKLHENVKDYIKFDGSVSLLRNIVKELGFKWKRSQGRRKVKYVCLLSHVKKI
jgi:nitrogenase molybdenum-iron protein alpha/beta subunit